MFYSGKLDDGTPLDALVNIIFVWVCCTGVFLLRAFGVEFISYYGHWLLQKSPFWGFLETGVGEMLFKSKTSLANGQWANTEQLLDRYTARKKQEEKSAPGENAVVFARSASGGEPVKAVAVRTISVGDVGHPCALPVSAL